MVIQRLQSLFLLIAGIVLCLLCFCVPIANVAQSDIIVPLYVKDVMPLLIINLLAAVLMFVDIFLFKNLKLQIKVTKVIMLLVVASMIIGAFVLCSRLPEGAEALWLLATLMMIVVLALTFFSYKRIKADHKLLRSYDRLR